VHRPPRWLDPVPGASAGGISAGGCGVAAAAAVRCAAHEDATGAWDGASECRLS